MDRSPRQIKILGRAWHLRFVSGGEFQMEKQLGECDHPSARNKSIRIANDIDGELLMDTVIHEMTHAAFPMIGEDWVEQFATDVARVVTSLGYARMEDDKEKAEHSSSGTGTVDAKTQDVV